MTELSNEDLRPSPISSTANGGLIGSVLSDISVETATPNEILGHLSRLAIQMTESDDVMAVWPVLRDATLRFERGTHRQEWLQAIRNHPIANLAWQDPFTSWSFNRPRGYPGDARLIDFIYGHPSTCSDLDKATPIGRAVFSFTYGVDTCVAVRERRRLLAHYLDATAERVDSSEVLAVACGHLREVELSRRFNEVHRLVALDQDIESLAEVRRSYPQHANIKTVQAQVSRFIVSPDIYGTFDLIYAAGLYDYLNPRTARRLTEGLFGILKPGGRLLFGNFATGIKDQGYMDMLMDWRLNLRNEDDIHEMVKGVPTRELERARIFRGNNSAVIYGLLVRK